MYCIVNIITKEEISGFRSDLIRFIGNNTTLASVYNNTSLVSKPNMMASYFHGKESHSVNYLLAEEDARSMRIFVEGAVKRENLDQLTTGVKYVYKSLARFFASKNIKPVSVEVMVWAEGEEMLRGSLIPYRQRVKEMLVDVPLSIYILVLTLLYTFISGSPIGELKDKLAEGIVNLLIAVMAYLAWIFIKAGLQKTELSFKIK